MGMVVSFLSGETPPLLADCEFWVSFVFTPLHRHDESAFPLRNLDLVGQGGSHVGCGKSPGAGGGWHSWGSL